MQRVLERCCNNTWLSRRTAAAPPNKKQKQTMSGKACDTGSAAMKIHKSNVRVQQQACKVQISETKVQISEISGLRGCCSSNEDIQVNRPHAGTGMWGADDPCSQRRQPGEDSGGQWHRGSCVAAIEAHKTSFLMQRDACLALSRLATQPNLAAQGSLR
jgi:hypothetical protein